MNRISLDWALCRSLLAILRTGSLSGAARALGVSHPTVRRHLEDIERDLGGPLFVRSPSGVTPTELAITLREPAEAMESAFEQLVRQASSETDAVSGTVRISASEVMAIEVLPPMLARLREAHPGLMFELDVTDAIADVLRRDADIAIRMTRPVQTELVARRVAEVEFGLYAHRKWLNQHPAGPDVEALVRERLLIGYDRETLLIDALARQGVQATPRDFGFRSDSTLAQLAAVRAGLGVAIVQVPLAERDPGLVRIAPEFRGGLEIWVVSHPNLRGSRRVRTCLNSLAVDLADYASRTQASARPSTPRR